MQLMAYGIALAQVFPVERFSGQEGWPGGGRKRDRLRSYREPNLLQRKQPQSALLSIDLFPV
jgi:hypothetical protein